MGACGGVDMANQVAMGRDKILEAITEAARELENLQQRANQLRDFIALGKSLLGQDEMADVPPTVTREEEATDAHQPTGEGDEATQGQTIAEWAYKCLEEGGKPMRVPEIAKILVERQQVKGSYATEVIRAAMGRRQDLFERVAFGLYALRRWPASLKRIGRGPSRRLGPVSRPRREASKSHSESLPRLAYSALQHIGKPSHFNEIIKIIEEDGKEVNRPSLLRGIYRCIRQGRWFYLDSPGIFGLLEWQDETSQQREEREEGSSLFTE